MSPGTVNLQKTHHPKLLHLAQPAIKQVVMGQHIIIVWDADVDRERKTKGRVRRIYVFRLTYSKWHDSFGVLVEAVLLSLKQRFRSVKLSLYKVNSRISHPIPIHSNLAVLGWEIFSYTLNIYCLLLHFIWSISSEFLVHANNVTLECSVQVSILILQFKGEHL